MSKVIVIGGGAAGMLAAITAAEEGHRVCLLEKNEKLGKKIYITGKGRCNLTNACDMEQLLSNVMSNRRFLFSAFHAFSNFDTMAYFEDLGLPLKTERGNRVFPVSDHASDVTAVLAKELRRNGVEVRLHTEAEGLLTEPYAEAFQTEQPAAAAEIGEPNGGVVFDKYAARKSKKKDCTQKQKVCGVMLRSGEKLSTNAVIIATGGLSYPTTGSTGDGYRMAKEVGHTVTRLTPSLVSLTAKESFCRDLMGLSLKNVQLTFTAADGKIVYDGFGEMLFTHKGVSGPIVLSATAAANDALNHTTLTIDLKPALDREQLDARIVRETEAGKSKQMSNLLGALVPRSLIPVLLQKAEIPADRQAGMLSREERQQLVSQLKGFSLTITGLGGYQEAVITKGGVTTAEVQPKTMESKLVKNLYFAGEVLDLDAMTGGYNLQIAWSTARAAGRALGEAE